MTEKIHRNGYWLGLLFLCPGFAFGEGATYISIAGGNFEHGDSVLHLPAYQPPAANTAPVGAASFTAATFDSDSLQLTWGVADPNARFLLEYYYQQADMEELVNNVPPNPDAEPVPDYVAATDYTKHMLFYSGYWTPKLYFNGLHGVVGAGIGASYLQLESDSDRIGDDFDDVQEQFKVTVGIEYWYKNISVFGRVEKHFTGAYSHRGDDGTTTRFDDGDQDTVLLGIGGRFE